MADSNLQLDRYKVFKLVEKYSDKLVLFAYCIVGDYYSAEDAVSDAYAKLLFKNVEFDDERKLKAYLYKTVRSVAIDSLRRAGYTVRAEDMEEMLSCDGEREIFEREEHRLLYTAIQKLPEQYRNAVCLVYVDGLSVDEARAVLKKTRKQVYNLLARAKEALKNLLNEDVL